jgi:hypothetical protein
MLFWLREGLGWGLIVLALYWLRVGINMVWNVETPQIIEASIIVFASVAVMRAGLFLIRLSTTARIALQHRIQ